MRKLLAALLSATAIVGASPADAADQIGIKRVAIIVATLNQTYISPDVAINAAGFMWGDSATQFGTIRNYFLTSSRGQLDLAPDFDGDSKPDVFESYVPGTLAEYCEHASWASQADSYLLTEQGIDVRPWANRIYIFPYVAGEHCGRDVITSRTATTTRSFIADPGTDAWPGLGSWLKHAAGHQLGWRETVRRWPSASVLNPNTDGADTMALGGSSGPNAVHHLSAGWFAAWPGAVRNAAGTGFYNLQPLAAAPTAVPNVIRIPDGPNTWLVSYRRRVAGTYDTITSGEYVRGPSVHKVTPSGSEFVKTLRVGEGFTSSEGLRFGVENRAQTTTSATVRITMNNALPTMRITVSEDKSVLYLTGKWLPRQWVHVDSNGLPVQGAVVWAMMSGQLRKCTTGVLGNCYLSYVTLGSTITRIESTIDSVTKAGSAYERGENTVPITLTLNKP